MFLERYWVFIESVFYFTDAVALYDDGKIIAIGTIVNLQSVHGHHIPKIYYYYFYYYYYLNIFIHGSLSVTCFSKGRGLKLLKRYKTKSKPKV
jgi:hypothetical protein